MFILGTANFGNNYSGSETKLDLLSSKELVSYFTAAGGCLLDTASAYGNATEIIEEFIYLPILVGTKIASRQLLNPKTLEDYLYRLRAIYGKKLRYCLLHDTKHIHQVPKASKDILSEFFLSSQCCDFGISVYFPDEIQIAVENLDNIRRIQAPLNYFDRRFIANDVVEFCNKNEIEVNFRSIFLQGNCLKEKSSLHSYFKKFSQVDIYYKDFINSGCRSLLEFNLSYILQFSGLSKVVVGVENIQQMKQIYQLISALNVTSNSIHISDIKYSEDLCIPMRWDIN